MLAGPLAGVNEIFFAERVCGFDHWYAHENAETHGGDPTDISLAGFSAGANMAAATVMYGGGEDLGCAARPVPIEPSKVVYFEGDTLLSPVWDQALRADPSGDQRSGHQGV